jgi:hypothetical protein
MSKCCLSQHVSLGIQKSFNYPWIFVVPLKLSLDYKCKRVCPGKSKVWQTRFFMMQYGLPCQKPTRVFGNLQTMTGLNQGPLSKKQQQRKKKIRTSRSLTKSLEQSPSLLKQMSQSNRFTI